ncbi:GGDEF domain-containing protein [Campylobacter suis]|uniref:GGDEF domain-containing protein n=1 Tax=Campylobacter suis TaxID=2790657 RepID=A0ABM8Q586_9BACT|nr:diguanylate cyclase [Campylobacter suis]CAD7287956.1 hypothetical protein LMG8286_01032 [Campylobacter suis]
MVKIDSSKRRENVRITGDSLHIGSQKEQENNIFEFSQSVLNELNQNNIPSIPSNYSIYFDKLLDERGDDFRQKLGSALDFYAEDSVSMQHDGQIYIEKEIKHSFGQIKSMLQAVALIYKNLALMKGIAKKHLSTLQSNTDILATQNVISTFNEDLLKLSVLMDKHVDVIKINYEEIGRIFKNIEEQAVYDSVFDVYNKRFLLGAMQTEIDSVKRYGYKSSFMLLRPSVMSFSGMQNLSEKSTMLKTLANTLQKTSRQSDIIAHYGDGVFAIIMKHTDISGAKLASNRILKLLSNINVKQNDQEISLEVQMVANSLTKQKSMEEALSEAIDTLENNPTASEPIIMEAE